jgi:hypothetical protein
VTNNYPVQYLLRLQPDLAEAVDRFRTSNQFRTESAAFRALLDLGLKAAATEQGSPEAA